MIKLNLPSYSFKFKNRENKLYIFDKFRKKYVVLTPEEWVRQNFITFLTEEKKYPNTLIGIEKEFKINNLSKRFDILVFDKSGLPNIIVECKAPQIKITQDTFDQIARYNLNFDAKYVIVTNGLEHFFCSLDHINKKYNFLRDIPVYAAKL
jgi:hypothetical protein